MLALNHTGCNVWKSKTWRVLHCCGWHLSVFVVAAVCQSYFLYVAVFFLSLWVFLFVIKSVHWWLVCARSLLLSFFLLQLIGCGRQHAHGEEFTRTSPSVCESFFPQHVATISQQVLTRRRLMLVYYNFARGFSGSLKVPYYTHFRNFFYFYPWYNYPKELF